jgi:hypothetical protein
MIRKIAALVGGAALATSLMAAGVGAQFTATAGPVTDTINVGTMSIFDGAMMSVPLWTPAPTNPGCTITVADIQSSSGSKMCYVWVQDDGSTIIPSALKITAAATSGVLHEANLWTVSDGSASGPLSGALAWNYAVNNASFNTAPSPWYVGFTVSWNDLTSASYGDNFVITFTVIATA